MWTNTDLALRLPNLTWQETVSRTPGASA